MDKIVEGGSGSHGVYKLYRVSGDRGGSYGLIMYRVHIYYLWN